nr:MAG TPA: hypothetical protein [Caudoviricetes sp.]
MIKVYEELTIAEFNTWGSAEITLDIIREHDKMEELEELAEEIFGDEPISDIMLNDWLWFDRDEILFQLDIEY